MSWERAFGAEFAFPGGELEVELFLETEITSSRTWSTEEENTFTVGYVLADDDAGDFISVDIGRGNAKVPECELPQTTAGLDHVYCTEEKEARENDPELLRLPGSDLIFQVQSGRTSNPWEPWYNDEDEPQTQPRDRAFLQIDPPIQKDIAPDEPAVFTLSLTNAGDSQETREYVLRTVNVNNPGGAVMSVNGSSIQGGHSYYIGAQQTQEVTLTVERGPNRFNYENLGVQLYPAGEYPVWEDGGYGGNGVIQLSDSVFFSVEYTAPCSDIEILRPEPNWVFNSALLADPATDSLLVILNNFNIPVSETDTVSTLGFEYRLKGANTWLPGLTLTRAALGDDDATSYATKWLPPRDGEYEMRAYTSCQIGGTVNSDITTGLVDTKAPLVLGTPEPTNEILSIGSDIAITFNEEIDCESISTSEDAGVTRNAELYFINDDGTDSDRITGVEAACNGTSIVLSPGDSFDWIAAENQTIEARLLDDRVDGQGDPVVVTDVAGNSIC